MSGRWVCGVGMAVWAVVLGVGCGQAVDGTAGDGVEMPRPPDAPTEQPPPPGEPPGNPPPPTAPPPLYRRYALPEGPWAPPDASTLAFEVPACVPAVVPDAPGDVKPCEVRTVRPDGGVSRRERFDAEGRMLEVLAYGLDGRVSYTVLHSWTAGREVRRVSTSATGGSTVREWTYDEAGRLVADSSRMDVPQVHTETRTFYDAEGRIERTERSHNGAAPLVRRYNYGTDGRLAFVLWETRDDGPTVVERFTYHPNGQLHTFMSRPPTMGDEETRKYDEAGRPLFEERCTFKGCSSSTRTYSAEGQPTRARFRAEYSLYFAEADRLYVYDSAGRPVVDALLQNVESMVDRYQERQVHRSFYACESGALLREEWDQDADGTPDGWRELERDAAGKLVVERFTGTAANPEKARVEYDYQCQ